MKIFLWIASSLLIMALFTQWIRLPLAFDGIWMSPDETANVISGINWAQTGSFNLENSLIKNFEWAYPRSFVPLLSEGVMAPVGFLGMPFIVGLFYKMFGSYGFLFLTPLFALLTLWALWNILPVKWSRISKFTTLLAWMSFPTVILYANRGNFPNLLVTCLAIWIWWFLFKKRAWWAWILSGLVLGLAVIIRPPEALWLVPVSICAVLYQWSTNKSDVFVKKRNLILCVLAGFFTIVGFGAFLGNQTYGKWLISGYQIRPLVNTDNQVQLTEKTVSIFQTLPFSVHPRNIEWNVKHYFFGFLLYWTLMLFVAGFFGWRNKIWAKENKWPILAIAWTGFWLVVFYGNGLYQDHVLINFTSLGNSFLRYTLPLSVVFAIGIGYLVNVLQKHWSLKILSYCIIAATVSLGLWSAVSRDNEGLAANELELKRYSDIRAETGLWLEKGTVVISDRSDKIFFPYYAAVSPIPEPDAISFMLWNDIPVALFTTTQDEVGLEKWQTFGLELYPLFTNGNESLYDIHVIDIENEWID